ncbi:RIP metalloprotease [Conexibacter sp. SYSU D00693]|uniref:M50 family metallopeptidase n=1 Tax=Conexibacter sp. SYSU D00693 TaxID=2812560 RepID=UPI00196A8DFE|nr:M50 family metallopeptidase [Conexibacter sp. SYSU D00693]
MSFLYAFLGFAALIILHELGHFAAAKAVGMRVERFSLFFPPLLARVKKGETEYAIGAVPLGGYVKITGMSPEEKIPPEHEHRAYFRQPVWKRIVVIAAGPLVNVVIAFVLIFLLFTMSGVEEGKVNGRVDGVTKSSPAAGQLRVGDRIVAVDGVRDRERFQAQISRHLCAGGRTTDGCVAATPAQIVVERDGRTQTVEVRPRYDAELDRPRIGISFGVDVTKDKLGAVDAADRSVTAMWKVTTLTVEAIGKLFYDEQARKEVSGVVGSYETTRQSFEVRTTRAIEVLALISLSLAIINLFPFLPLDGGHIFWALAEKVRGRAVSVRVMERASVVGFFLVMVLFVIGLSNDIGRLTGEGFDVR